MIVGRAQAPTRALAVDRLKHLMFSSRLFWKLMLACAGLNLAAAVVFGIILSDWQQERILEQVDRRLHDNAHVVGAELADLIQSGRSEALQERVRRMGRETETRFTLVALDGTVLADSQRATLADVEAMDNHRDRPELVQARTRGQGTSLRPSATLDATQRYFALRVAAANGDPIGYVRTALSVDSIEAQMAAVRGLIWSLVAIVSQCVMGLSYWIVAYIIRPIGSLTRAAEAIASGDYQQRVYLDNRDELGTLARTFNQMSQQLDARMKQLGQTGDRQLTVLGGMIEGVIAVDPRRRIVLANRAAGELFEFNPTAAEGRPLLEVVRNHAVHEAVTTALSTGESQRVEAKTSVQHAASAIQYVDIHVQPLPGEPCPGVVLVMQDTTELRRLESLRRDFIANVSHELKTPLSSIKAYAETLRNGALRDPEASQKFLGRIEEQADRLHHLILDMLMLARIESDQKVFDIVPVSVPEIVSRCLEDHRSAADAKRITLAVDLDGAPPETATQCSVRADREGLREILGNLIDNAIKYTPESGKVSIGWRCGDSRSEERELRSEERGARSEIADGGNQNGVAQIFVRDTGIGIKAEDQRRVFERFYRVDKARSRELGGTGLGLSIVKHLVQSFGGKVGVESEPGKGSTFVVELPTA
jgi:two-component system phosphate regulon sensor histidine kinase PhoR